MTSQHSNSQPPQAKRTTFWEAQAAAIAEDLQWLLDAGESAPTAAKRLGYAKQSALARRLYRHGYLEAANALNRGHRDYPKRAVS